MSSRRATGAPKERSRAGCLDGIGASCEGNDVALVEHEVQERRPGLVEGLPERWSELLRAQHAPPSNPVGLG